MDVDCENVCSFFSLMSTVPCCDYYYYYYYNGSLLVEASKQGSELELELEMPESKQAGRQADR